MFEKLEQAIGYTFRDKSLLKLAMTHPSYAGETHVHNQRLEFLGDAVLQLCTSVRLYKQYPDLPEGKLSRLRARCVQESALEVAARRLHLGENLLLGIGEERGGGREKPSILADAMEALLGAMYLDGGMETARAFILPFVTGALTDAAAEEDYKTKLQEIVQQNPEERLRYVVTDESGPDHNKHFVVEVHLNSNCIGKGEGHSKKLAEQQAAKEALALMGY